MTQTPQTVLNGTQSARSVGVILIVIICFLIEWEIDRWHREETENEVH